MRQFITISLLCGLLATLLVFGVGPYRQETPVSMHEGIRLAIEGESVWVGADGELLHCPGRAQERTAIGVMLALSTIFSGLALLVSVIPGASPDRLLRPQAEEKVKMQWPEPRSGGSGPAW